MARDAASVQIEHDASLATLWLFDMMQPAVEAFHIVYYNSRQCEKSTAGCVK